MELIFASSNPHKIREINQILSSNKLRIKGLKEIGFVDEIAETGHSLEENALIKARHIYKIYNRDVFAEDTGLEVYALNNKPGVHTARYASGAKDPLENMNMLLKNLEAIENRSARFRAVIALIIQGKEILFEGIVEGWIEKEKRGTGGFGYDPVFRPLEYDFTFGELAKEIKNKLSHRVRAFHNMQSFLFENNYI